MIDIKPRIFNITLQVSVMPNTPTTWIAIARETEGTDSHRDKVVVSSSLAGLIPLLEECLQELVSS